MAKKRRRTHKQSVLDGQKAHRETIGPSHNQCEKTRKKNQAEAYKKIKAIRTKMEEEGERVLLVIHPGLRDEFQLVCQLNHYTLSEGIRQAMRDWPLYRSFVEKKLSDD